MDLETAFAHAIIPVRHWVLGVRLEPFSVGHAVLLQRLGSPFAGAGGEPGAGDLATAVFVCAMPWRRAVRGIESWRGRRFVRGFGRRGAWAVGLREFAGYLQYHTAHVEVWEKPGQGRGAGLPAPLYMLVVYRLMRELHVTEEQALDMPMGKALWFYILAGADRGALDAVSSAQEELIERAMAMRRELEQMGKAGEQRNGQDGQDGQDGRNGRTGRI